jgi:hypothetical protein
MLCPFLCRKSTIVWIPTLNSFASLLNLCIFPDPFSSLQNYVLPPEQPIINNLNFSSIHTATISFKLRSQYPQHLINGLLFEIGPLDQIFA